MKSEPSNYFVIKDAKQVDERWILSGEMIIEGAGPHQESEERRALPGITFPKPFKLKWILPSRMSEAYHASKAFAESMGLATVELDDLSYPPPR